MVADRSGSGTALDHIGVRVRHWRLERNLTQRVLADLAGLTQGYGGDIGRCLAAVTKAARIAEETRRRGAATPDDLPVDPWHPLIETLRYRSPRR